LLPRAYAVPKEETSSIVDRLSALLLGASGKEKAFATDGAVQAPVVTTAVRAAVRRAVFRERRWLF
jgi:hypothetical protein